MHDREDELSEGTWTITSAWPRIHELVWLAHTMAFVDTAMSSPGSEDKDSQYAVTCSSIAGMSRRL